MSSANRTNQFTDALGILENYKNRVELMQKKMKQEEGELHNLAQKVDSEIVKEIRVGQTSRKLPSSRQQDHNGIKSRLCIQRLRDKLKTVDDHIEDNKNMMKAKTEKLTKSQELLRKMTTLEVDFMRMMKKRNAELNQMESEILEIGKNSVQEAVGNKVKQLLEKIKNLKKEINAPTDENEQKKKLNKLKQSMQTTMRMNFSPNDLIPIPMINNVLLPGAGREDSMNKCQTEKSNMSNKTELAKIYIEEGQVNNANQQTVFESQEMLQTKKEVIEERKTRRRKLELKTKNLEKKEEPLLEKQYRNVEDKLETENKHLADCKMLKEKLDALVNEVDELKAESKVTCRHIQMAVDAFCKDFEKTKHCVDGAQKILGQLIAENSRAVEELKSSLKLLNNRINDVKKEREKMDEYISRDTEEIFKESIDKNKVETKKFDEKNHKEEPQERPKVADDNWEKSKNYHDKVESAKLTIAQIPKMHKSLKGFSPKMLAITFKMQQIYNEIAATSRVVAQMRTLANEMNNDNNEKVSSDQSVMKIDAQIRIVTNQIRDLQLELHLRSNKLPDVQTPLVNGTCPMQDQQTSGKKNE